MGRSRQKNEPTVLVSSNHRLTSDPEDSEYPQELLPTSWVGSWITPYQDKFDLKKKHANQVTLLAAPDYVEPEYELQELPSEEEAEADEE